MCSVSHYVRHAVVVGVQNRKKKEKERDRPDEIEGQRRWLGYKRSFTKSNNHKPIPDQTDPIRNIDTHKNGHTHTHEQRTKGRTERRRRKCPTDCGRITGVSYYIWSPPRCSNLLSRHFYIVRCIFGGDMYLYGVRITTQKHHHR